MSVFTTPTDSVKLPIRYGHPPQGLVAWAIVLDLDDSEPWVSPCPGCTVVEADGIHQAGCSTCRGRGWFNDRTGLPVGMWVHYFETDRAEWLLHDVVPTLLRAAEYHAEAAQVAALPSITTAMLHAKRVKGTGLLEQIAERVERDAWERLEVAPDGLGRFPTPAPAGGLHAALVRASEARRDFDSSRLGWWAYRVAIAAAGLLRTRRHRGDDSAPLVDAILDHIEAEYEADHGMLMIEEDLLFGPERQEDARLIS